MPRRKQLLTTAVLDEPLDQSRPAVVHLPAEMVSSGNRQLRVAARAYNVKVRRVVILREDVDRKTAQRSDSGTNMVESPIFANRNAGCEQSFEDLNKIFERCRAVHDLRKVLGGR